MTTERALTEIHVSGDHTLSARDRLEHAFDLIERRRRELLEHNRTEGLPPAAGRFEGPAFLVHIRAFPALLDDGRCLGLVRHLADHGARFGVVAFIYGDPGEVATAAATHSGKIAAALAEGRALRMAPTAEPANPWMGRPETAQDATYYSETLSAELWAALVLANHEAVASVFAYVRSLGETPGGPTERRLVADQLRRTADILLPGAGGMLLPLVPCPLCIASPLLQADEFPSHLLEVHGSLREALQGDAEAVKLLRYALQLRQYGERAPGGGETWAEFDGRCEAFLRGLPAPAAGDAHDDLIEALQRNMPQEWEASEGSAESIIVDYVREIERRVMALGGSLDRFPGDPE